MLKPYGHLSSCARARELSVSLNTPAVAPARLSQLYEEKQELKSRLKQADEMKRAEEKQKKQQSFKFYQESQHYQRTRPRVLSTGIDPWRRKVDRTMAVQKAESKAARSFVSKVSQAPHKFLAFPKGLSPSVIRLSFLGHTPSQDEALSQTVTV